MEIQKYFEEKTNLQGFFLEYISSEGDDEFMILINYIEELEIPKNPSEIKHLLRLLTNISCNYHRVPNFFSKIKKILLHYKENIKQTLSNLEIFHIFINNKPILLFLIKEKFITPDEFIIRTLIDKIDENGNRYCHFFLPEIKKFIKETNMNVNSDDISEPDSSILINYEEKRLQGENESYICSLIRQDSIEEFVSYVSKSNLQLTSKIEPSIYETNPFLIGKRPTLMEYTTFWGSIQIFNYLRMNEVDLTPSLWLYAIHSNNAEIIHILEDNQIDPEDESFLECCIESIKCHHINIANYIFSIYSKKIDDTVNKIDLLFTDKITIRDKYNLDENINEMCFRYYNYSLIDINMDSKYFLYYLCNFDYLNMVKIYINSKKDEINAKSIFFESFLNNIFKHFFFKYNSKINYNIITFPFSKEFKCNFIFLYFIMMPSSKQ